MRVANGSHRSKVEIGVAISKKVVIVDDDRALRDRLQQVRWRAVDGGGTESASSSDCAGTRGGRMLITSAAGSRTE